MDSILCRAERTQTETFLNHGRRHGTVLPSFLRESPRFFPIEIEDTLGAVEVHHISGLGATQRRFAFHPNGRFTRIARFARQVLHHPGVAAFSQIPVEHVYVVRLDFIHVAGSACYFEKRFDFVKRPTRAGQWNEVPQNGADEECTRRDRGNQLGMIDALSVDAGHNLFGVGDQQRLRLVIETRYRTAGHRCLNARLDRRGEERHHSTTRMSEESHAARIDIRPCLQVIERAHDVPHHIISERPAKQNTRTTG